MKSLNDKIIVYVSILLLTVFLSLGVIVNIFSSKAMVDNASDYMMQIAAQGSHVIESRLKNQISILEHIAEMKEIKDSEVSLDKKMEFLKEENQRLGHIMMAISDKTGQSMSTRGITSNIEAREYFKKALAGRAAVSDPLISREDKTLIMVYAVPIKDNNEVIGVLIAVRSGDELSNITDDITLHKTGRAFVINSVGVTIAHSNRELVYNMDNDFQNIKRDPGLADLFAIENRMVNREKGFGTYTYNGEKKCLAFYPIKDTGWSLAVAVKYEEILENLNSLNSNLEKAYAALIIVFLGLAMFVIHRISGPIKKCCQTFRSHCCRGLFRPYT